MDNFERNAKRMAEIADKSFDSVNKIQRIVFCAIVAAWILSAGFMGFIAWVIYKILQHNGIIG